MNEGCSHLIHTASSGGGSSQPQPSQTPASAQRRDVQELEARLSSSQLERIFENNEPYVSSFFVV